MTGPSSPSGGDGPVRATPTVRLRLDLGYDGTAFSGWAVQPGLRTVQGDLEAALCRVLRLPAARTTVAGRTDAGVHARGQVVHLDVPAGAVEAARGRHPGTATDALLDRLAGVLVPDVVVHRAVIAPPGFDARFSATGRTYAYRLTEGRARPLRRHDVAAVRGPLDVAAMAASSTALLGLHDFAAFCKRRDGATTVRTLRRVEVARVAEAVETVPGSPGPPGRDTDAHLVVVLVEADAFCHSMVRSLVGTLVSVGQGRRPPSWPAAVLAAARRDPGVQVAPARGLVLERVDYAPEPALAERARAARTRRQQPAGPPPVPGDLDAPATGPGGTLAGMSESDQGPTPVGGEPADHDPIMEMADTDDDAVLDAQLDTGYSPPERERHVGRHGLVPSEQARGETLDERLAEEVPDVGPGGAVPDLGGPGTAEVDADADVDGELLDDEVGSVRAGRLVTGDADALRDTERTSVASDVGPDGGAASAEEAAVHVVASDAEEADDLEPRAGRPSV